jgi:hypothetical protein
MGSADEKAIPPKQRKAIAADQRRRADDQVEGSSTSDTAACIDRDAATTRAAMAYARLQANRALTQWDADGYVRLMPDRSKGVHMKWKWTYGPHKDHYVYVYCRPEDNAVDMLDLLFHKAMKVEEGLMKPTPDKSY